MTEITYNHAGLATTVADDEANSAAFATALGAVEAAVTHYASLAEGEERDAFLLNFQHFLDTGKNLHGVYNSYIHTQTDHYAGQQAAEIARAGNWSSV